MSFTSTEITNLSVLAKRLEGDIRSRQLQAGERYLTASEAGVLLGVSAATAHRAMNVLVHRSVLTRQQGRGTFIGPAVKSGGRRSIRVRTVYILQTEEQKEVTSVQPEVMIDAIRRIVGGVNVQLSFVPTHGAVEYVRELIGVAHQSGQFAGAVPISCPREVYRCLAEMGGPLVVLGSLYADQKHLPSVDLDYRQAGYLLGHYLIGHKHRRLALLTTGGGRPGDNAFYDGLSEALTEASLPHNALTVRTFPHDFEAFRAQTRELLQQPVRPTGIICGSDRLVGTVAATIEEMGLSMPEDVELVFQGQSTPTVERLPYTHVQPTPAFRQIAELIAGMLKQLAEGRPLEEDRIVIPVERREPRSDANGARRT